MTTLSSSQSPKQVSPMISNWESDSNVISRSCVQLRNAHSPSSLTVLGMNTCSMSLQPNHSVPTTSSPFGSRSTFRSSWSRPSYSRVIVMCEGMCMSATPVPSRQSQPSSWISSLSSNFLRLRHSLKARASIFLSDGGAIKDSRPERQNAWH